MELHRGRLIDHVHGACSNGSPGIRPYHPDDYAAFLLDPLRRLGGGSLLTQRFTEYLAMA